MRREIPQFIISAWFCALVAGGLSDGCAQSPIRRMPASSGECTPGQDDYYEALFTPAPGAVSTPDDDPVGLPAACFKAAMKQRPLPTRTYLYARCESETGAETIAGTPPPCLSDHYVNATREAYLSAMRCLGEDPRELFGMFANEAGFQVNLGNTAKAWGAAQITPWAGTPEDHAKLFTPYADKPECESAAAVMKLEGLKKVSPCLLTHASVNPLRSFVIGGLAIKRMRSVAAKVIPRATPAAERKLILRDLSMQMYNQGDVGVSKTLKKYLSDHPDGASTYARFKEGFSAYLSDHYGEGVPYYEMNDDARASARHQVSGYAARARSSAAKASEVAGVDCGP